MTHKVGDLIYDDVGKMIGVIKRKTYNKEYGADLYDIEWSEGEPSCGLYGLSEESVDYLKRILDAELKRTSQDR